MLFCLLQIFDHATILTILSELVIAWELFYIPVLWLYLLTCKIYNFVLVEFLKYICTLPSIIFKAIHCKALQTFHHQCFQIIHYMDLLKDKIENVLWWKVLL